MRSVTPEPSVSAPAYGLRARQERLDPPSHGFSALVDSNAAAASSDRKPIPASESARDDRRNDSVAQGSETSEADSPAAPSDKNGASADDASPTKPGIETGGGNEAGKKHEANSVVTEDKKAPGETTQNDTADVALTAQPLPAIVPDVVALVTVITAATEPAATPVPATGTPSAPAAIAAAAAATVAAVVAAASPQTTVKTAKTVDTSITAAAEGDVTLPGDAEIIADGTIILSSATAASPASGKTETSIKPADDTVSGKDGNKDGKQTAESSLKTITPDQAEKPDASAAAADGKSAQHNVATTDAKSDGKSDGKSDANSGAPVDKAAPQPEHRAQTAAPSPQQPLQPDQILQPPSALPQPPIQNHLANLTAVPVSPAQAALAANTPVPVNGLAVDIALRAAGGSSRFEIRLDPAELGRIDVRLDVDKHGNVTSHLTVERPATLDMLRRDAPQLQQALEDAGLKTGDSGLQFSLRDQSSSGRDNDGSSRNSRHLVITEEDTVPAQVAGRTYGRMLASSGGVDIRI